MIEKLASEELRPRLAISLNAPENELRTRIMPINKQYPLDELIYAVKNYQAITRQRVTFEYVMIKGLNDSPQHARTLVKLLRNIMCNVNLIVYNPHPKCKFQGSDSAAIKEFASILNEGENPPGNRRRLSQKD